MPFVIGAHIYVVVSKTLQIIYATFYSQQHSFLTTYDFYQDIDFHGIVAARFKV